MLKNNYKKLALLSVLIFVLLLTGCSEEKEDLSKCIIDTSHDGAGKVNLSPDKNVYQKGDKVTLTATPADNYEFAGWVVNDGNVDQTNPKQITIQAPVVKAKARFKKAETSDGTDGGTDDGTDGGSGDQTLPTYIVGYGTEPADSQWGTVSLYKIVDGKKVKIENNESVKEGTKIGVRAERNNEKYGFAKWKLDDGTTAINNPYEFEVTQDINLTAVFKEGFDLEFDSNTSNAKIDIYDETGKKITDDIFTGDKVIESYAIGKTVVLAAEYTGNKDYGFYSWFIDGEKRNAKKYQLENNTVTGIRFEITGNTKARAEFSTIVHDGAFGGDWADDSKEDFWDAVRESLNKMVGPLTKDDLADVEYINAEGYDITDKDDSSDKSVLAKVVKGEQVANYFTNLETLYLDGAYATKSDGTSKRDIVEDDLVAISSLESLKVLNLADVLVNKAGEITYDKTDFKLIDAFSKFDKLSNLERLNLNNNNITNINFIQNLKKLWKLNLNNNQIKDLTPLNALTAREGGSLSTLYVLGNPVYNTSSTGDSFYLPSSGDQQYDSLAQENYLFLNDAFQGTVYNPLYTTVTENIDGKGSLSISAKEDGTVSTTGEYYPGVSLKVAPSGLVKDAHNLQEITVAGQTLSTTSQLNTLLDTGYIITEDGTLQTGGSVTVDVIDSSQTDDSTTETINAEAGSIIIADPNENITIDAKY